VSLTSGRATRYTGAGDLNGTREMSGSRSAARLIIPVLCFADEALKLLAMGLHMCVWLSVTRDGVICKLQFRNCRETEREREREREREAEIQFDGAISDYARGRCLGILSWREAGTKVISRCITSRLILLTLGRKRTAQGAHERCKC